MSPRGARLSTLVERSRVQPVASIGADPEICGASLDSRRIEPGDLFFAIQGLRRDGAAFVSEALERGAAAVVAATPRPPEIAGKVGWVQVAEPRAAAAMLSRECYGRPDEALALLGITGTNGKTSVTYLVEAIGMAAGRRCGRIGTLGYAYGGRQQSLDRTTPEAPDFYRLLAEMRDHGVDLVPMEVSSHALSLCRVAGARFAAAAFLNLSQDHLDFHRNVEAYFEAKARLFEGLGPEQTAILPAGDPYGERIAAMSRARVLTFGRSEAAEVRLCEERSGLDGSSAILRTPSGKLPIRTFLLGRTHLENIAVAGACALALGLPPESIPAGVLALAEIPGRMERIASGQPFIVLVDYAHTGAALARLLEWARGISKGRVLVVFGCGGGRDESKRPIMGRIAAEGADEIFLTSDNPRGEDPERILEEIAEGVRTLRGDRDRWRRIADRREAIRAALSEARPGDVVIIAGKGHERVQTIGDRELPFDDRSVARAALEELGFRGGDGARA